MRASSSFLTQICGSLEIPTTRTWSVCWRLATFRHKIFWGERTDILPNYPLKKIFSSTHTNLTDLTGNIDIKFTWFYCAVCLTHDSKCILLRLHGDSFNWESRPSVSSSLFYHELILESKSEFWVWHCVPHSALALSKRILFWILRFWCHQVLDGSMLVGISNFAL